MRAALLGLAALAALATGCLLASDSACATSPLPEHELDVEVADACALYAEGSEVTWRLTSRADLGATEADLQLGDGLALVSGDFGFAGEVRRGDVVERRGVVRATAERDVVFRAWADVASTGVEGPGAGRGFDTRLGVRWSEEKPETFTPPPPAHGFRARLDHEVGNATRLVATFSSDVDVEAHAHLYFSWPPLGTLPEGYDGADPAAREWPVEGHPEWSGERVWQGDIVRNAYLEWRGHLKAGEDLVLRFHAPWPGEEGTWTVAAHLLPDPEVHASPVSDTAYLRVADGHAEMVRETPR